MARGHVRRLSRETRQKFREGETKAAAKVEEKAAEVKDDAAEKAEKKAAVKKAAERND